MSLSIQIMNKTQPFSLFDPSPEHYSLRETIKNFVTAEVEPQALEFNRKEIFNTALFRKLGDLGLLGITASDEHGGSGFDATACVIAHEELSASDPAFCLSFLAHSMLCVNNIAVNANEEQKKMYLPKLSSGEWIGAMGMSETEAGTDVLSMRTTATLQNDHYILNGRKMWITNGCIDEGKTLGDVFVLYARTNPVSEAKAKISTFILTKDLPGFSVGQKIRDKLGMRASNTAELVLDNVAVPRTHLIGEEGGSIKHMMRNLEIERVTLAAMSLGIARRCIEVMTEYAKTRKAFGKKIAEFGQIQQMIADSFAEYQAARSYVYYTAANLNLNKEGSRLDSDGVKLFATPMAKRVADRAIQVLGGNGYIGEYVVERLWRDAKLLEIGGGTIEAHQKNILMDLIKQ
jgi:isovaleryl-CoA dehydrogenase